MTDSTPVPRRSFVFSGHMIDRKERSVPRFPADKAGIAAQAIARLLQELGVGPDDLGLCGGACGGDLLFAEAMLARGARVELRIPFDEARFLPESVTYEKSPPAFPDDWQARYDAVKQHPRCRFLEMVAEQGPTPPGISEYERFNRWLFDSAPVRRPEDLELICLWNRERGDGAGGTAHMVERAANQAARVHIIDTTRLW